MLQGTWRCLTPPGSVVAVWSLSRPQVKRMLRMVWVDLRCIFKHYAGISKNTFGMSWLAFDHFATRCGLLEHLPLPERKRVRAADRGGVRVVTTVVCEGL